VTRALVTGAGGFAGRHLVDHLRASGDDVTATARSARDGIGALDVSDRAACATTIRDARPDVVYHLAARTEVQRAERERQETLSFNVFGTLALLEACEAAAPSATCVLVSSGQIYSPSPTPVAEDGGVAPGSFYGLTKKIAEDLALHLARQGRAIVVARPFNHVGPMQREEFAVASFAAQIARAERSGHPARLHVGNLDAVRDFLDVRDVVRAYRLLAAEGRAGEVYNVCSGVGRRIGDVLAMLVARARVKVDVEVETSRLRAGDAPVIVGDSSKLRSATGWRPEIPFERTLDDVLEDARRRATAT